MIPLRQWLTRLSLVLATTATAALVAVAQAPASIDPVTRDVSTELARDISGAWQGSFRLDSAWKLPQRASERTIPARLRFSPVGAATQAMASSRSVHAGTFEIDFSRFGFTLSTAAALGWSVNDDAMRAVLNPTIDHGLVEVHGTFRGEAIVGTWRYVADPGGASGTFDLRRGPR